LWIGTGIGFVLWLAAGIGAWLACIHASRITGMTITLAGVSADFVAALAAHRTKHEGEKEDYE
jgi:hypothetical protein